MTDAAAINPPVVGTRGFRHFLADMPQSTFYQVMKTDPSFPKPKKMGRRNIWDTDVAREYARSYLNDE